ncbi:hypothetical protein FPOAC2_01875 [Fusarium poae]|jgi:hypothetical protein|uniref:hypothetical protein n=1 Tax=Fusarium poae TaxID=36050 RepID=UPI001CEAE889|nr:hypothetical protein FPOAC1_001790 [Fusarium poae]KAG8675796.1 hypothetical protein FPOAC1_001790 [Fusarium poae]
MSYSSQRYDLDAAAARKRSQSFSRSRDHRYNDQPYRSHACDDYYRAPTVSRTPSYVKRDDHSYMRREASHRSLRDTRTKEENRSYADRRGRVDRSSSHREASSSREGRHDGRANERPQPTRDAHAKRQSRPSTERRQHVHSDSAHSDTVRSGKRTNSRRESQVGQETKPHSKREDTSQREGEYSRPAPEEINTFLNSGRASNPTWGSSTYGTYVFPLESRGQYRNMDPTKCTCKCCPHPIGTAHGHNHHNQGSGMSSKRAAAGSRRSKRTEEGRYLIQVVDKSRSALNRENGPSYPISLNPSASCDRIASFLAPDKRYAKVLVHWDGGRVQRLDNDISMEDLIRHAEYLEVREMKSVHWAA